MKRTFLDFLLVFSVVFLCTQVLRASEYPHQASIHGSVIQLLVAANGGKPALLMRCLASPEHSCVSEMIMLIDHPHSDRIQVGDRICVLATFDSKFSYRGVGGEQVAAVIYKYRSEAHDAAKPKT